MVPAIGALDTGDFFAKSTLGGDRRLGDNRGDVGWGGSTLGGTEHTGFFVLVTKTAAAFTIGGTLIIVIFTGSSFTQDTGVGIFREGH